MRSFNSDFVGHFFYKQPLILAYVEVMSSHYKKNLCCVSALDMSFSVLPLQQVLPACQGSQGKGLIQQICR